MSSRGIADVSSNNAPIRPIRAIDRALDVLEALTRCGPSSLQQLHAATGLSKSALRRVLATLIQRRFIRQGISDRMYRSNIVTPSNMDADMTLRIGHLVEVARPHMMALTEMVRWPSDLHIYTDGRMRILESTHGLSPFGGSTNLAIDSELNIFAAASGLCYLASMGDTFALHLAGELESDDIRSMSRFGLTKSRLLTELASIRRRGFATRRASQGPDRNRNAIAVTIEQHRRPIGALTISWQRNLMPTEKFAAQHLAALRAATDAISEGLHGNKTIDSSPTRTVQDAGGAQSSNRRPRRNGSATASET